MDEKNGSFHQVFNKAVGVISRVMEISHWIVTGLLLAGLIVYLFNQNLLPYLTSIGNGEFSIFGYSIRILSDNGDLITPALILALIVGIASCSLIALIFRNIYRIFKTITTKKGTTPFQPENARMLRELGIFALAIPIIALLCDTVTKIIVGNGIIESSISASGIIFGLILLCLSQFFAYGVQLQKKKGSGDSV